MIFGRDAINRVRASNWTNVHPQPICGRELSRPYGMIGESFLFPFSGGIGD